MRALVVLLLSLPACAVRLDEPAAKEHGKSSAPVAPACRWFPDGERVSGRVSSVPLGSGKRLFIAAAVGATKNAGLVADEAADASACFQGASLLSHPVLDDPDLVALSPVVVGGVPWLYYARYEPVPGSVFPERAGIGVARWDQASERFVPSPSLLWTGDRPSYGSGALVVDDFVYVYGCQEGGFLSSDCFVARAPAALIDDESAYGYYAGGGNFAPSPDQAFRAFEGGDPVSVMRSPAGDRFVAAYVTPLGTELTVRSGLGPAGPWSKPRVAFACELGDDDSFCTEAVLHQLGSELGASYAPSSFAPGAAEANSHAFWSRLATLTLPPELP